PRRARRRPGVPRTAPGRVRRSRARAGLAGRDRQHGPGAGDPCSAAERGLGRRADRVRAQHLAAGAADGVATQERRGPGAGRARRRDRGPHLPDGQGAGMRALLRTAAGLALVALLTGACASQPAARAVTPSPRATPTPSPTPSAALAAPRSLHFKVDTVGGG